MIEIETRVDGALVYMLRLAKHIPKENLSIVVLALLIELGFKTNTDGFCYLRNAILVKTEHPEMRYQELYHHVGKVYGAGATWQHVERTLRHAIGDAWKRRDPELWGNFFPESLQENGKRPSDSLFIAQMACMLELWNGCCKEVCCDE